MPKLFSRRNLLRSCSLLSLKPEKLLAWTHGVLNLASFVGPVPASLNMLVWNNNWGFTDFANSTSGSSYQDASLTFTRSSINITSVSSPTSTPTAQHLAEDNSNNTHFVVSTNAPQTSANVNVPFRIAAIAKAAERTRMVLSFINNQDANGSASVGFDLAGGNTGYDNSVGSNMSLLATHMTSLGNGWWLCYFDCAYTFLDPTPANRSRVWTPQIFIDAGSGTAARDITYAGNGTSGINLWWWNILPTAAWTITKQAFFDDFNSLSTIDVNNTQAPGFNWYVRNIAPNSPYTTFEFFFPTSLPTPASSLSISSPSVLQLFNSGNSQPSRWMSAIWSIVLPDAGGFIGQVFGSPMAWDSLASWDGSTFSRLSDFGGLGPAMFGHAIEMLTNTGLTPTTDFIEWDVVDVGGQTGAAFDWHNPSSPVATAAQNAGNILSQMTLGIFRRTSGLWVNAASNTFSTWGYVVSFLNGQAEFFGDGAYDTSTGNCQNGNTMSSAAAAAQIDAQHLPVFWMTGTNTSSNLGGGWPLQIDYVKVYTKP